MAKPNEVQTLHPISNPPPPTIPERARLFLDRAVADASIARVAGGAGEGEIAEAIRADTWAMADELAGPSPSPMERTLAETAALAWLALRLAESRYETDTDMNLSKVEWHQRVIGHAHRRYLSSLRALATVRRLALPVSLTFHGPDPVNLQTEPSR